MIGRTDKGGFDRLKITENMNSMRQAAFSQRLVKCADMGTTGYNADSSNAVIATDFVIFVNISTLLSQTSPRSANQTFRVEEP